MNRTALSLVILPLAVLFFISPPQMVEGEEAKPISSLTRPVGEHGLRTDILRSASNKAAEKKEIRYHTNGGTYKDGETVKSEPISEKWGFGYPSFSDMRNQMITYRPAPGYEVDKVGRARSGFFMIGWATTPDATEDISRQIYADKITETTDFYAVWKPIYYNQFHANGGMWYYSKNPAELGDAFAQLLRSPLLGGATQPAFGDVKRSDQDAGVNKGVFTLRAPNSVARFKGWYLDPDKVSAAHDFTVPATEPRDAYAHWTTQLRIDVLGKDNRNMTDYKVEVTDKKDRAAVAGAFTGNATGKPNDQWQSERHDIYMGDEFTIRFSDLPAGQKLEVISIPTLDQIAWVKPVEGQTNTFTVSMRTMPHKSNQEAYYARFRVVPESYKVNFVAGENGTVALQDTLSVEYNKSVGQVPKATAERGYRFAGWRKDQDTARLYTNEEVKATPITADTTFTAVFEENTCQIRYNANGGTFADNTAEKVLTVRIGTTITIMDAPVRAGHKFLYWEGSHYNPGDSYEVLGGHTFTAIWETVEPPRPTPPEKPANTDKPTAPSKPAKPDEAASAKPSGTGQNSNPKTTKKQRVPQTGEPNHPILACLGLLAGTAGIALLGLGRRKYKDQ